MINFKLILDPSHSSPDNSYTFTFEGAPYTIEYQTFVFNAPSIYEGLAKLAGTKGTLQITLAIG